MRIERSITTQDEAAIATRSPWCSVPEERTHLPGEVAKVSVKRYSSKSKSRKQSCRDTASTMEGPIGDEAMRLRGLRRAAWTSSMAPCVCLILMPSLSVCPTSQEFSMLLSFRRDGFGFGFGPGRSGRPSQRHKKRLFQACQGLGPDVKQQTLRDAGSPSTRGGAWTAV